MKEEGRKLETEGEVLNLYFYITCTLKLGLCTVLPSFDHFAWCIENYLLQPPVICRPVWDFSFFYSVWDLFFYSVQFHKDVFTCFSSYVSPVCVFKIRVANRCNWFSLYSVIVCCITSRYVYVQSILKYIFVFTCCFWC